MATKKKAAKKTGFGKRPTTKSAGRPAGKAKPARRKAPSAPRAKARPARAAKPAQGRKPARGTKPVRGTTARAARPVREAKPSRGAKPVAPRRPVRAAVEPPTPQSAALALAEVSGPTGAAAAAVAEADDARPTALAIAHAALDKKAEDVTVLDVRGLTSYADYFVLVTADSDRQAGAIADHVEQEMKAKGVTKVGVEGYQGGRWILVDYGDVVAHVMNKESRGFYDLEGLWADAPRFRVEG